MEYNNLDLLLLTRLNMDAKRGGADLVSELRTLKDELEYLYFALFLPNSTVLHQITWRRCRNQSQIWEREIDQKR